MPLIRTGSIEADIENLRAKLTSLEAAVTESAEQFARAKAGLERFRIRYRKEVGQLHEELDELLRQIAEAELIELAKHLPDDMPGTAPAAMEPPAEEGPRYTSDAIRKLFRDVAKTIHPDLASDEETRDRRHMLMAEANRAYALGDLERLRRILAEWEGSPEAVQGTDPEAERERLARRIARAESQLSAYDDEMAAMKETPLWRLKAMVDEATAQGKDLVADMVKRLERDILAARNRLDAMRWRP